MSLFHKSLQILKTPVIFKTYNKVCGVSNADRIHDYLYLGNIESSKDELFLKKNQIYCIINCTEEEPFAQYFDFKPKLRIPVKDSRDDMNNEKFYQYLHQAVAFIDKHVEKKDVILVHCYWGFMRSATVVAAHLIKKYHFTPQIAIDYVKAKRPKTFSHLYNFNDLLERYYQEEIINKRI
jgi:predicted protein tyrosine phosphatase